MAVQDEESLLSQTESSLVVYSVRLATHGVNGPPICLYVTELLFMEQISQPFFGLQEPCWSRAVYKRRIILMRVFISQDWRVESLS